MASIILSATFTALILGVMICCIYDVGVLKDMVKESGVVPSGSSSMLTGNMKFGISGIIPAFVFALAATAFSIVGYAVKDK